MLLSFHCWNAAQDAPSWTRTGGPVGGLGYNVKTHPGNRGILLVNDAFSGVHRSTDSGKSWRPANEGITTRGGPAGDAIPVFALARDKGNPEVVWAGTQGERGIFKSTDGGATWIRKDAGIAEGEGLTIRHFEPHPRSSDTVYASGELSTGVAGDEFERVKGVIYRTVNGGDSWSKIWEDSSLARWICIDPANPQSLVAATGIFDREALNFRGEGVIRTQDGGQSWTATNDGLASLFAGGMAAHPSAWGRLYLATGNYSELRNAPPRFGGIYTVAYPGQAWTRLLGPQDSLNPSSPDNVFTAVAVAPSNANVLYAANAAAFYRSSNGGMTWQRHAGANGAPYGPPGLRAGVPIEITVDAANENILYVANYGGGVFKSGDGARSFATLGTGLTGAAVHGLAVKDGSPLRVLAVGRSGPFQTLDGGANWAGEAYGAALGPAEWFAAALQPGTGSLRLIADEHAGLILRNAGGIGTAWTQAFKHPGADPALPSGRHGAKALAYSPASPQIAFAGFAAAGFYSDPEDSTFAASFGVYKSRDGGTTWSEKNAGLEATRKNVLSVALTPVDSLVVYIGLRGDGVFKSVDGGESWSDATANLPSRFVPGLAVSPFNPRVAYAATLDKGIFKTANGGVTWVRVLADTAGSERRLFMALVVDPKSEDRVYAADWRGGVHRTANGGVSWTRFNEGLTQRAVNALAISSDGSMLYAGTLGQGVFRAATGTTSKLISQRPGFKPRPPPGMRNVLGRRTPAGGSF